MNTQMNSTARKIHNLLTSGAVTVTGPTQPRNIKTRIAASHTGINANSSSISTININNRCYICDENFCTSTVKSLMTELETTHTNTKFPNKLGQLVGPNYTVIVGPDDMVCSRCTNLINYLDRLENDVDRVRSNLMNLLQKKYNIIVDDDNHVGGDHGGSPPIKMQKLNTGSATPSIRIQQNATTSLNSNDDGASTEPNRKVAQNIMTSNKSTPPVSAVQQLKISTPSSTNLQQQSSPVTQNIQRKSTKIYKCLMCDYKTSDMRLFNTHFESCKNQNFQCKNCRKIFPNFGSLKGHMVREHNTSMDNTCAVCHVNFVSELSLRKHMETNHATNVVVTSTTTLPAGNVPTSIQQGQNVIATGSAIPTTTTNTSNTNNNNELGMEQNSSTSVASTTTGTTTTTNMANLTTLYACNQCQFKSPDKTLLDEHLRNKHNITTATTTSSPTTANTTNNNNNTINRIKPFKCRICAQRFETRDAATTHAKQHQPNFFKCGVCSLSFSKREMLVKHFADHDHTQQHSQVVTTHQQQQQSNNNNNNNNNTTMSTNVQQPSKQQQSQKSSTNSTNNQQRNIKLQQQHQQDEQQQQITTQKLLQDTINEALSINATNQQSITTTVATSTTTSTSGAIAAGSTGTATSTTNDNSGDEQTAPGSNIRFFSCQVCSLTFIQKNYYTQHMETHRREAVAEADAATGVTTVSGKKSTNVNNAANGVNVTTGIKNNINILAGGNIQQQKQQQQQQQRRTGGGLGSLNAAAVALLSEEIQETKIATAKAAQKTKNAHTSRSTVNVSGTTGSGGSGGISDADIESIFEKMHSEKSEQLTTGSTAVTTTTPSLALSPSSSASSSTKTKTTKKIVNSSTTTGPVVITSTQAGVNSGGISFNISIPGTDSTSTGINNNNPRKSLAATSSVSIDMPALDTPDDAASATNMKSNTDKDDDNDTHDINGDSIGTSSGGGAGGSISSVSMPSLDDEGSETHNSNNMTIHQQQQQQQLKLSGENNNSGAFGTHKLDELAAAAEGSSAAELAESGIHHVAAAAVAAAAADEAAAAAAEAAEHKQISDVAMDQQEMADAENNDQQMEDTEHHHQLHHHHHEHEQQEQEQQQHHHQDEQEEQHNADETNGTEGGTEMDLDEAMHAQVEGGQIKFILNENGQLLQLDNHIITDADGNQILVQDPEQIQQLLQSVGVLQSGDGLDGETLQMMTDANGQMVLVQGEHNETQLIDASLLNADGQLVIQQGQDGELGEGAHVIGEDGTRIPVSVSYTADGQPIVQVHNQMLQATNADGDHQHQEQQQHHQQQQQQQHHHHVLQQAGKEVVSDLSGGDVDMHEEGIASGNGDSSTANSAAGAFLALEELMQQQQAATDVKNNNE